MPSPLDFLRGLDQVDQVRSTARKYGSLASQGVPLDVLRPFMQLDVNRIQAGQQPYSPSQTAIMALGATRGQTVPPPKQGFWGHLGSDLRGITSSLIHLPGTLLREAQQLPQAAQALPRAISSGSPTRALSALSEAPVWRMLPGAFTVHSLTTPGQAGQLAEHPVFTVLDLLPYASRAAGLTKAGAAAELEGRSPLVGLGQAIERRGEASIAARNPRLGRFMPSEVWARAPFGSKVRQMMETVMPRERLARKAIGRLEAKINRELGAFKIPDDRLVELWHGAQAEASPEFWASVTPHEQAFLRKVQELQQPWEHLGRRYGELVEWNNELYSREQAPKLVHLVREYQDAADHLARERSHAERVAAAHTETFRPWEGTEGEWPRTPESALREEPHPYAPVTQLVPRRLLEPFREFDRALPGQKLKPGQTAVAAGSEPYLRSLEADIKATGIRDPIILDYNPENGYAHISEGNHRLAIARKLGIEEVPVRGYVAKLSGPDRPGAVFIGKDLVPANEHGYRPRDVLPEELLRARVARGVRGKPRPPSGRYATWAEKASALETQIGRAEARAIPARWVPVVAERMRQNVANVIRDGGSPADWAQLVDYAEGGFYRQLGMSTQQVNALARDARRTWLDLKAQGYSPQWFHQVGEKALREVRYPRLIPERDVTPSQLRRRGLDMTPSRPSFGLSLTHQAAEWMIRNHSRRAWDAFVERGIVRPALDVQQEAANLARRELGLKGDRLTPGQAQEFRARTAQIVARDFDIVDPESIFPIRQAGLQAPEGVFYAPKAVAGAIERLRTPPGEVARLAAKPLKVFRISVLAASPQYYVNNIIGDSIMLLAREGPGAFKHLPDAVRMLKGDKVPASVTQGLMEMPPEYRDWDFAAGRKLANLLPHDKVWKLAEFINDTGRTMSYLRGMEKSLAKGESRAAAHLAGLETANRVYQNWDSMTPIERSVIRGVMPFYGFTRYVMRYLATFPFDHPIRASVTAALARTELEDWRKGGLGDDLLNILFLGHPDAKGNVKGVSTRGLNPFYDVGSLASWAGWVSKVNPLIGGAMRLSGLDPQSGPELYPELTYDPASGRLKAAGGSLLDVAAGFVPQVRSLAGLLGATDDIRQLRSKDPEAFKRFILSGARVSSFVPTSYNLAERKGKAELARYDQLRAALVALSKGDPSKAEAYPQLMELIGSKLDGR